MYPSESRSPDGYDRSALYKLLSLVFRYPSRELFGAFRDGSLLTELQDRVSRICHSADGRSDRAGLPERALEELRGMTYEELEVRFVQTFDAGMPAPPCPPYEHAYQEGNPGNVMVGVSEFYKHFGLEMHQEEGKRDLPDHLCAELEFLHFLTFKEAQAERDGERDLLAGYRLAQKDFLERHLARWMETFSRKLRDASALRLYDYLGEITEVFIAGELQRATAICTAPGARN